MPINPRSSWYPYRLVLPVLAVEILFVGVPLVIGVYYSLHRADYFQLTGFVGLQNYITVLESPVVRESLAATAIFSVFSLALTFGVGLALALYLERDTRLHVFARAVVLVPYTIAMLVGSLLLKWIVSIDVFFQFIRMVYHWNTPGVFAGWTFLAHFAVLVALTYFVSIYKPKGI